MIDSTRFRWLAETLPRYAYRFSNEVELHVAIADLLERSDIPFEREVVAGPQDRFDFLVPPGIVIEAKVKGSLPPAISQCSRYASRDDVTAVLLVTTRFWGRMSSAGKTLNGKPFQVVHLKGAAF